MKNEFNSIVGEFYGVDLHVHTPASFCYKGEKSDKEYLSILNRYHSRNIRIIAATDHNTLKGYKHFEKIKNDLENQLSVLSIYALQHPELNNDLHKIKSDLELFGKVLILPGVELEVRPGVHLLLIFNPKSDLSIVEKLLIDTGYTDEIQGKENPDILPNYDVHQILDKVDSLDTILIAAHADSNKGIYNVLKGIERAFAFRSSNLTAISYNSTVTCEKMKSMLLNKEYKREKPLAFIQCSDYHGDDSVGANITYLSLKDFSFESIKLALSNPNECVSPTEKPEIINIIKQIIEDPKTLSFGEINTPEHIENVKKAVCALLNEGYGSIVIGAQSKEGIVGIANDEQYINDTFIKIFNSINPSNFTSIRKVYPFGNKIVVVHKFTTRNPLYYLSNNEVYFLKDSNVVIANPLDIQDNIESKLLERIQKHQKLNQPKIGNLINGLTILKDNSDQFSLIHKIEKNTFSFADLFHIDLVPPFNGVFSTPNGNGTSKGNVFFISRTDPRLSYAYLRCSCPRTNTVEVNEFKLKKFSGTSIIVAPGGGTYFIDNIDEWILISLDREDLSLVLQRNSRMKQMSELAILGWLKSSLCMWYCDTALGGLNIHKPVIFNNIPIPYIDIFKKDGNIEKTVLQIIDYEYAFLNKVNEPFGQELEQETIKHNSTVAYLASQIDHMIFDAFGINSEHIELINRFFNIKNIFNLSSNDDNPNG